MKFYTYIYRRPNGEPIYVGKGSGKRAWSHLKRTDHHPLTHCLNKMKRDGESPTIQVIYQKTEKLALLAEALLISEYGRKNLDAGPLLNLTNGGEGPSGSKHSEVTRAKMSASHRGVKRAPFTPEHRARISLAQRDSAVVTAGRLKQAEKMRGRKEDPECKARRAAAISAGHARRRALKEAQVNHPAA